MSSSVFFTYNSITVIVKAYSTNLPYTRCAAFDIVSEVEKVQISKVATKITLFALRHNKVALTYG